MDLQQHDSEILVSSAARTSSFDSVALNTANVDAVIAYIEVTAVSGTSPTLDIKLQDSPDGTAWYDVQAATQITAIGKQRYVLNSVGSHMRAVSTIAGTTPSFTYSITLSGKN